MRVSSVFEKTTTDLTHFVSDTFKDVDGRYSSKRTTFFVLTALVIFLILAAVFVGTVIPQMIWDSLCNIWSLTLAAVFGEQAPKLVGAWRGESTRRPDLRDPGDAPARIARLNEPREPRV